MKEKLPNIFIFTALECEAKGLISQFNLKRDNCHIAFSLYRNENIILTVTGIGKIAMAGAVTYVLAQFQEQQAPVLLNLGIAGHKDHTIGDLFVAEKICDAESGKVYYPQLIGGNWPESKVVKTTTTPNTQYNDDCLNDMEASAFYEMAVKFTSSELIHCLKVVSDNQNTSIAHINPKLVVEWVSAHNVIIEQTLKQLTQLREMFVSVETPEYDRLIRQWHFTVSGKLKLKAMLVQWRVLNTLEWSDSQSVVFRNGKDILRQLAKDIEQLEIKL